MSLAEEHSQENDCKEPEIPLEDDEETNESNLEVKMDKNRREKRITNPLSFLREDMSQLKDEVLKVFNSKAEHENRPLGQAENKCESTAFSLLKHDFYQFKEGVSSVFSVGSSKDKESKTINRLKEDLSHFRHDLSSVFKIGLLKERDAASEDSSQIRSSRAQRSSDQPAQTEFRGEQKASQRAENGRELNEKCSKKSEGHMHGCFKGNLPEQEKENVNVETISSDRIPMEELGDYDLDLNISVKKTESICFSEPHPKMKPLPPTTAEQRYWTEDCSDNSTVVLTEEEEEEDEEEDEEDEEEEEEENPSETILCGSLSSGIRLFSLADPNKDNARVQPEVETWSVKNFACYLTFDPNTANSELHLTDCNRTAARVWLDTQHSEHPERFELCPQVLCREGLLDSAYWEVAWKGGADIGVTYNNISRGRDVASCLLGHNQRSWSLECSEGSYTPCHGNKRFRSTSPKPFSRRVGVYLDWCAGSVSFYCVSQNAMVHLYTFTSTFTEPLYPAFWVWAYDGSVSLCQVELDWERLL